MNQLLLILHLLGLGAGITAVIGNTVVRTQIQAAPGDAPVLGRLPPILARVGQIGIGLLWVTGLIMVWTKHDGFASLPSAFIIKFAAVVVLTVLVVLLDIRIKSVSRGDMAAAKQLPILGNIAGATLVVIVVFAVIAFN